MAQKPANCPCGAGGGRQYLPFKGLSAWFSSSVPPNFIRRWRDHGGVFAGEGDAQFLFSDDSFAADTIRVYTQQKDICVFLSSWILEVVKMRLSVRDVPLGKHCLQPHYLIQQSAPGDPYATPVPFIQPPGSRRLPGGRNTAGAGTSVKDSGGRGQVAVDLSKERESGRGKIGAGRSAGGQGSSTRKTAGDDLSGERATGGGKGKAEVGPSAEVKRSSQTDKAGAGLSVEIKESGESRDVGRRGVARVEVSVGEENWDVEDSQQYLTGEVPLPRVRKPVEAAPVDPWSSETQFLELEREMERGGIQTLLHIDHHEMVHRPLPVEDLDLRSGKFTMTNIFHKRTHL